jgi:hypothetical protein
MTSRIVVTFVLLFLFNVVFSQVSGISSSNLPLTVINTNGKTIVDASKIRATLKIIYNGSGKVNKPSDPGNRYNVNIGIEIHGAYSASLSQKPYGFETRDQSGAKCTL